MQPTFAGKSRYLLIALVVVVLDQWSKWRIEALLGPDGSSPTRRLEIIPGFLNFIYVENTGVAFGFLAGLGASGGLWALIGLGVLALAFVIFYFRITPIVDRLLLTALGLVLGGAIGNLIDRVTRGAVTDFVDAYFGTYHWHTFNVADSAITIGIGLMLIGAFKPPVIESAAEPAPVPLDVAKPSAG